MPIYVGEQYTREDLERLQEKNVCAVCGEHLDLFMKSFKEPDKIYLACTDYPRTHHEGIVKEASPYQEKGDESLNILARRQKMVETHGMEKATALAKFENVTTLTKQDANEILTTIYPEAPKTEIQRAMLLCYSYSLNPLMGHVFLIPFRGDKGKTTYATVLGIKATRLLASRRGKYGYLDDTPRLMTEKEQIKIYGEVQKGYICAITRLKDAETGAEAPGYGKWKISETVYGTDKGNSALNMAFIRSERQALERLRPGEMPMNVEVVDERFVPKEEASSDEEKVVSEDDPEVMEGEAKVVEEETGDNPAYNTVADLMDAANQHGWALMDIGKYANSDDRGQKGGWGLREKEDLNKLTTEQIGELIDAIQKNPKK